MKPLTTMKAAQRAMPRCLVGTTCDDASDLAELRHLVRCELDLIEEDQDAADDYSRREVAAIRRYYARLQRPPMTPAAYRETAARNRQEAERG